MGKMKLNFVQSELQWSVSSRDEKPMKVYVDRGRNRGPGDLLKGFGIED